LKEYVMWSGEKKGKKGRKRGVGWNVGHPGGATYLSF